MNTHNSGNKLHNGNVNVLKVFFFFFLNIISFSIPNLMHVKIIRGIVTFLTYSVDLATM